MVWSSAAEFFQMGGYGLYVWGSAAMVFGLMISELFLVVARNKHALAEVADQDSKFSDPEVPFDQSDIQSKG